MHCKAEHSELFTDKAEKFGTRIPGVVKRVKPTVCSELRSCVNAEVDVLSSPSLLVNRRSQLTVSSIEGEDSVPFAYTRQYNATFLNNPQKGIITN